MEKGLRKREEKKKFSLGQTANDEEKRLKVQPDFDLQVEISNCTHTHTRCGYISN